MFRPASESDEHVSQAWKRERVAGMDEQVRVVSYNVLADHLCRPSWFPYRDKADLEWDVRKQSLKETILGLDADILCLQEVQTFLGPRRLQAADNHFEWFDSWLRAEMGYTGVYGARVNSNGKTQSMIQIGNLLYWKADQFHPIVVKSSIPLVQTILSSLGKDKEMKKRFCHSGIRGTVVSIAALTCKASNRSIAVATTHLPAPRSDQDGTSHLEQLVHVYALLTELSAFLKKLPTGVDSIVLAGDMNSLPGNSVCTLLEKGYLTPEQVLPVLQKANMSRAPYIDKRGMVAPPLAVYLNGPENAGLECVTNDYFRNLSHPQDLASKKTNVTENFQGWIDHIFLIKADGTTGCHARIHGDPVSNYLPDPRSGHPSDHVPLMATILLEPFDTDGSLGKRYQIVFRPQMPDLPVADDKEQDGNQTA